MNYKPRPGIVTASLCGMNVLIPSRVADAHCTTILPLSLIGSIIWTGVEKDYPIEKVLEVYHIFSKKPDEELIEKIDEFCKKLVDKGFAIPKDVSAKPPLLAGEGDRRKTVEGSVLAPFPDLSGRPAVPDGPYSAPCSGAQCAPEEAHP